jgi:hypothetical protein
LRNSEEAGMEANDYWLAGWALAIAAVFTRGFFRRFDARRRSRRP